jgi:choline-sulfatase
MWVAAAAVVAMGAGGCGSDPARGIPEPGPVAAPRIAAADASRPWNLLLITLDTTRHDRLGCYGCELPLTPTLDSLAREGVLFERAISAVPVTLPSHTTIMTGLNPNEHGVRNNGTFVLEPARVTLAEVLSAHGYATGATVGAFPVAAQFGLSQGFDHYDDQFPTANRVRAWQSPERRAEEVTDRTLAWIATQQSRRFFHWAHYFDPHSPYLPPEPFKGRFSNPYDGEIAYMDAQIGRLVRGLEELDLLDTTWILLVGDHGEALGEHQEPTHSMLIYGATQHVPLIVVPPRAWQGWAGKTRRGTRVAGVVGLRDLAPTMLEALGVSTAELPASGASLMPAIAGRWRGPQVVYTETLVPALDYGWSELRGVRTERWSYIRGPEPELYDLAADPGETQNAILKQPEVTQRLAAWCDYLAGQGAGAYSTAQLDQQTIEQLRSLGYVAGAAPTEVTSGGKDPKACMPIYLKIDEARTAHAGQQNERARALLEEALAADPGNPAATRLLGNVLLYLGRWSESVAAIDELLARTPGDSEAHLNRVRALIAGGRLDEAEQALDALRQVMPADRDARELYFQVLAHNGKLALARRLMREAAAASPQDAGLLVTWARIEWGEGQCAEAERLAREALEVDPAAAGAQALLGEALWRTWEAQGSPDESRGGALLLDRVRAAMESALANDPVEPMAAFRLAWLERRAGNFQNSIELYERVISVQPTLAEAHVNLANLLRERGAAQMAMQHYEIARALGDVAPEFLNNYGIALVTSGRRDEAQRVWEEALAQHPEPRLAEGIRRNLERLRGQPARP